jgi:hypothetical protein
LVKVYGESRMRENRTSGSMRGKADANSASPFLLYRAWRFWVRINRMIHEKTYKQRIINIL